MLTRIARDTAIVCGLLTVAAALGWPGEWRVPLGVAGGGSLVWLSGWAVRSGVDGWLPRAPSPDEGHGPSVGVRPGFQLVKFFTRHAMLAVAAYGMMVRLHLDPMGMLAGVSSLGVAVGVEAVRGFAAPKTARRGR